MQEKLQHYMALIHNMYQGRYGTALDNKGNPKVEGMIQGKKGFYIYELVATFSGIEFYLYNDTNKMNLINRRTIKDGTTEQRFIRYVKSL